MTVEMVLSLPTLQKWGKDNGGKARRADGTWIIPNAPKDGNGENSVSAPTGALRSHNTNVKFVVNGAIFECPTLGEACHKLFGVNKPAEIAATFENWHSDYFAVGSEEPKKAVIRDNRKIWLTKVG
jgi:hypothetical protein